MNDNQFSLAGNIVRTPVLKRVGDAKSVTSFRVASTPRRFDPSVNEWRSMEPVFLTVNCWHKLAERVVHCFQTGDPVVVSGRLRMRTYEVEGERRTVYEVDAQHVSPDLNRVAVDLVRVSRPYAEPVGAADPGELVGAAPLASSGPLVPPFVSEPAA